MRLADLDVELLGGGEVLGGVEGGVLNNSPVVVVDVGEVLLPAVLVAEDRERAHGDGDKGAEPEEEDVSELVDHVVYVVLSVPAAQGQRREAVVGEEEEVPHEDGPDVDEPVHPSPRPRVQSHHNRHRPDHVGQGRRARGPEVLRPARAAVGVEVEHLLGDKVEDSRMQDGADDEHAEASHGEANVEVTGAVKLGMRADDGGMEVAVKHSEEHDGQRREDEIV
mmetsp:Transcript_11831/g.27256  ORF Transcript_11831/g.27256 Transcript_11831/m.27256 type:complete len:223 (+) Transcript_11831:258-926(+)